MPAMFRQTKPHTLPPDTEIVTKDGKPHARIRDGKQTKLYPLTVDGERYLRPTAMWCAMVRAADGRRKPVRLSTDKDAATVLLAKLLTEIEQEKAGIKRPAPSGSRSPVLAVLLTEYRAYHADQGNTPEQTTQAARRCELAFAGCKFLTLADLDAGALDRWLAARRRESARFGIQTRNHYVAALKAFGNWLADTKKTAENPFRSLVKQNVAVDVRHARRPLTGDEFDRLLTAARAGKRFRKLAGADRAMLYVVAAYTGFRASELASLTSASFALDTETPTLTVEAGYSKHRRKDTVPVHPDLATQLRPWLAGIPADAPLWPGKWAKSRNAVDLIRRDLELARAAWIAEAGTTDERAERENSDFLNYEDASGGKADFHSLRHRFITELVKAGVQPKDAKELARHSTITLTMDRYAHVTLKDTAAALAKLTGPTVVGSSKGVAPGVADRGELGGNAEKFEDAYQRPQTGGEGCSVVMKSLPKQGFGGTREGLMTIEGAEGEGFEPSVRTGPTPVFKTGPAPANALQTQGIPHILPDGSSIGSSNLADAVALHVDLARVVELWPTLPPAIRAAILTLANASAPNPSATTAEDDRDRLPPGYEKQR